MSDSAEFLRIYADGYRSGIYTKNEAVGAMIDVLRSSHNCPRLWKEVPDWAQSAIWIFLKGCDDSTVLHDISSGSSGTISPNLIALKNWLIKEMKYN